TRQPPRQFVGEEQIGQLRVRVLQERGMGPWYHKTVEQTAKARVGVRAAPARARPGLRVVEVECLDIPMRFGRNHDDPRWSTRFQRVEQEVSEKEITQTVERKGHLVCRLLPEKKTTRCTPTCARPPTRLSRPWRPCRATPGP